MKCFLEWNSYNLIDINFLKRSYMTEPQLLSINQQKMVNIDSSDGLLPGSAKSLVEPILV